MKNNKGITLVALIVTVIILLILAGISVSILTGDNGIIKQAGNVKNESKKTDVIEKIQTMLVKAAKNNKYVSITEKDITEELTEELKEVSYEIWSVKAKNGEIIRIDFNENDSYIIYDGKMEENTEFENANGIKYRKFEIYDKTNSPRK